MVERPTRESRGSPGAEGGSRVLPFEARAPTPDARCVEATLPSLDTPITPTDRFFIRSHFAVPPLDASNWRLSIGGAVERPRTVSYAQLRAMPHVDLESVLECAGNSRSALRPRTEGVLWGHGAVGVARWRGVRLRDLLVAAGPSAEAREVLFQGADRGREPGVEGELAYEMSVSMAKGLDPDTLLVDEMNGEILAPSHGYPVRVVVPDWYGMASVKWLVGIEVRERPFEGHFRRRAYAYIHEGDAASAAHEPVTSIRTKSLITWPGEGQVLSPSRLTVHGVAWSGERRLKSVELSVDRGDGPHDVRWISAALVDPGVPHTWTHWSCDVDLSRPGFYVLRVRATDSDGTVQPEHARWNFRGVGTNSWHAVPVEVRP
jgi:DMSO/TMAO reductase YedYZ molybdopterin-dependent catalytic subunit